MGTPEQPAGATLRAGVHLFNGGRYLAAHELFEELWLATEGEDADFYKGLIQAAIALHHLAQGNREGAAKLFRGQRRLLASYLPRHHGLELERFLGTLQSLWRAHAAGGALLDPTRGPKLEFHAPIE